MPGRGSYGSGGKWIHDRANSLMDGRKKGSLIERYGEKRGKSIAYAIATQQAHKVGKSPKKHRTAEGVRTAKRKFGKPMKEYQKTAMLNGFFDEMEMIDKEAGLFSGMASKAKGLFSKLAPAKKAVKPGAIKAPAGKPLTAPAKNPGWRPSGYQRPPGIQPRSVVGLRGTGAAKPAGAQTIRGTVSGSDVRAYMKQHGPRSGAGFQTIRPWAR
jgi:hypothetical protein